MKAYIVWLWIAVIGGCTAVYISGDDNEVFINKDYSQQKDKNNDNAD